MIEISRKALDAHCRHGDHLPGGDKVPGDDCLRPVEPPQGESADAYYCPEGDEAVVPVWYDDEEEDTEEDE
ncbi:MAG: hypothetical protein R6U98_11005 [Pirellulaceae bacterium]